MLATEAMRAYVAAARLCVRRRGAAAAAAAGGGSSAPAARPFASSAAAAQLTTVARRRVPHTYDMDDDVRSVLLAAEARPKGGGAAAGEPEPAAVKTMRSAGRYGPGPLECPHRDPLDVGGPLNSQQNASHHLWQTQTMRHSRTGRPKVFKLCTLS